MPLYDDGRLILPGGKQELKPFKKEMKKLQNTWAIEMSRRYRRVQPSARKWAYLSDEIIDVLIGTDTETTMALILGLAHAHDEAYLLALDATQIMHRHGAAFYQPGGQGTRDPRSFVNESQDIMARRKEEFDMHIARAGESRKTDSSGVPLAADPEGAPNEEGTTQISRPLSDSEIEAAAPADYAEGNEEDSIVQQLERLASLFQQNLITEAEYKKLKSKLIDG